MQFPLKPGNPTAEIDLEWFLPKNSIWSPMLSTLIHLAGSLDTSDMNSKNLLVLEAKHCSQIIKRDKTLFCLYIFIRFSLWSNFFFSPILVPILENASRFCPRHYIRDGNCTAGKRKILKILK